MPKIITTIPPDSLDIKEAVTGILDLPMAIETVVLQLNLPSQTAQAVGQAVTNLLQRLPHNERDDDLGIEAGVDFKPRTPQTLPVPVNQLPALPGCPPIRWSQIKRLPGYRMRPIRDLGNDVFMSFPCFRSFRDAARERRLDGHGEVLTISDFTHDRTMVNHMANLITERGTFLDVGHMDYGAHDPNYHPEIAIFMTDTWTFKLVRDKIENGAPANANFIYAWPGGTRFYRPKIAEPFTRRNLSGDSLSPPLPRAEGPN